MKLVLGLTLATTMAALGQPAPTNPAPSTSASALAKPGKTMTGASHKKNGATAKVAKAPAASTLPAPADPEGALPAVETVSAPAAPKVTLDSYLSILKDTCALSKDEEQQVHDLYLNDGTTWQQTLADASLSPLQQEQKLGDLRDRRNGKIEALLIDAPRQSAFRGVESQYRVALDELAAVGGLTPVTPPPPAPSPSVTTPAQAEQPKA